MTTPPKPVVLGGFEWLPYSIHFDSPDGKFGFVIYAISLEHAHLQVAALKETAVCTGQILGTSPA